MEQKPSIIVCAYHNVGYRCLEELIRQRADIALVFTHDDAPSEEIWFASVRELAQRYDIPVVTSDINLRENVALVQELAPDLLLCFYYRNMLREEVLRIPRLGALNLHGSYLPKFRGQVPVNWAVIKGDSETGATLHYMTGKPDAGDIVDQEKVGIEFRDTALDVLNKVTQAAVSVLARSLPLLLAETAPRVPMDLSCGSYFGRRRPDDGRIDWNLSALEIYNLVRGVTHPYPGAFSYLQGKKIVIWNAAPADGVGEPGKIVSSAPFLVGTGQGLLEILSLQEEESAEQDGQGYASQLQLSGLAFSS